MHIKNKFIIYYMFNVKFCVFLGREKNMKILHSYIELGLSNNIINEYHMFDFSRNTDDHNFILKEYERLNILFINKIFIHNFKENEEILSKKNRIKTNWSPFYKYISSQSDDNDIIIKCDDDILFIDIFSLKDAIIDRFNDKTSFLIHSNCINNGVCAYFQRDLFNKIKDEINTYPKGGILGILFEKPEIAYAIHNQFCTDIISDISNLNKYIIDDEYINSRISINFILINGCDTKYLSDVSYDDEYELSSLIPEKLCRYNKIKGDLLTSHLSYTFQEKILLNKNDIMNNYIKLRDNFLLFNQPILLKKSSINNTNIPICHVTDEIYEVKNWVTENSYYIKDTCTNKYLYIDYEIDEIKLSDSDKTFFEINKINNIIEINLGIYYLTRYNYTGKFRNENILLKYLKDNSEKKIIMEDIEYNTFYLKFIKYNNYLSATMKDNNIFIDINSKKTNRWIFEKKNKSEEYIKVTRYIKNKKMYYKNIITNEVYTNYYNGWGLEGVLF